MSQEGPGGQALRDGDEVPALCAPKAQRRASGGLGDAWAVWAPLFAPQTAVTLEGEKRDGEDWVKMGGLWLKLFDEMFRGYRNCTGWSMAQWKYFQPDPPAVEGSLRSGFPPTRLPLPQALCPNLS